MSIMRYIRRTPLTRHPHYKDLWLSRDGRAYVEIEAKPIHDLMLETYRGPRPPLHFCCHKDDDPKNARIDNLYWGKHQQNNADRVRNGRTTKGWNWRMGPWRGLK